MKISVIIPTYKPQDYLWECLDSLVKQSFPKEEFEVILVLNGCTEPYKSAIKQYIAEKMQDMNVNFIHTDVGGVSNARNLALDQVRGEFVTFIDDDDFVSVKYLELLYEKADSETISLCYPHAFNDGDVETAVPYPMRNVYEDLHDKNNIRISSKVRKYFSGPWMKLIPMNFIQGRRFNKEFAIGEDAVFMFLISDCFEKFSFANKEAIYYRRFRQNSAITTRRNRRAVLKNSLRLIWNYSCIYMRNVLSYNMCFYFTRVLGSVKVMLSIFKQKI